MAIYDWRADLHNRVAAVCPIHGLTFNDDKPGARMRELGETTTAQRAAGEKVIKEFFAKFDFDDAQSDEVSRNVKAQEKANAEKYAAEEEAAKSSELEPKKD